MPSGRPFSPLPPPHIDIFRHVSYSIHHPYPTLRTMRTIIMLNIQHLTKVYGEKKAVDDLSLHIAPGEI